MSSPDSLFTQPPARRKRKSFDLHKFLIKLELAAFHIAATVIVLVWLYHHLMHEIGR
jgi:hypothetical protein